MAKSKYIFIIKDFFTKGHPRSIKLKRNIGGSFFIKGFSIVLGLIKIPIILAYLDSEKYGVWLTIASIVMWVQQFDLGLGHGLRNKLAESFARNDKKNALGLISTAYISMTIIMISIMLISSPIIFIF